MNITGKRQSQFELFPGASENNSPAGKQAGVTKDLTLSLENIIVLSIVFVMALVFFFSCGVERGKRLVALSDAPKKARAITAKQEPVSQSAPEIVASPRQGEQVVYPVEVPREINSENEPSLRLPLEKDDEQENLFTVQVASFKQEKNAQKEADRLKGVGHGEAFVLAKGSYSIVCVGKFGEKKEAQRYSAKLKKKYTDCMIRSL